MPFFAQGLTEGSVWPHEHGDPFVAGVRQPQVDPATGPEGSPVQGDGRNSCLRHPGGQVAVPGRISR